MNITEFIDKNYLHFNAAALKDAAQAYKKHVDSGGKMLVTLAGAMSTAELGITLAEMIRQDKVHAISCTGANLEEDLFHLVAAEKYVKVPNWRDLRPQDDHALWERHLNRVTDVCIPESEAMRVLEGFLDEQWEECDQLEKRQFPHQNLFDIIRSGKLEPFYQKDPKTSWMLAAAEKNLPMFVPGWEDSTTANMYAGRVLLGKVKDQSVVKSGTEYMVEGMNWYREVSAKNSIGMFQIGGGIAGDFVACIVPTLNQDFRGQFDPVPFWGYHCQICDSTTSYGSFSGCTPSEKITWGKLSVDTPNFVIESDATIVAPLIFNYVMGQ
jgi:deoxyhypusine synthase